jgi:NDP-sugar pyrophosphorylase family protein
MKAMILAAGLGTRLRPITDSRPKALVELNGRTLLEITLTRLRSFGITEVIVNVHHFAEMVVDYLKAHENFGMRIEISHEEDLLLDTGGGLKKASWFFLEHSRRAADKDGGAVIPSLPAETGEARNPGSGSAQSSTGAARDSSGSSERPFLLHNVDVISNIDFRRMLQFHNEQGALATLAGQSRDSSRLLLFDDHLQLVGRAPRQGESVIPSEARDPGKPSAHAIGDRTISGLASIRSSLAFSGIHMISPRLLPLLTETGVFSIIDAYVRLAAQGEKILAFRADEYYWRDLGRPSDLSQAAADLQQRVLL